MPFISSLKTKLILLATLVACTSEFARADLKPDVKGFDNAVKPLLQKYCVRCHGGKTPKAEIGLDNIDPDIIAGQGTIGMEILRQVPGDLDAIFIAVGGGGLATVAATGARGGSDAEPRRDRRAGRSAREASILRVMAPLDDRAGRGRRCEAACPSLAAHCPCPGRPAGRACTGAPRCSPRCEPVHALQ